MNINKVFEVSNSRARRWHPEGIESWSSLEWAGAMAGEAGEAANAAKKLKRMEDKIASINDEARSFSDLEEARHMVSEEAADTIFYALLLMARVGCESPAEVLREKFNAVSEKYGFPERI